MRNRFPPSRLFLPFFLMSAAPAVATAQEEAPIQSQASAELVLTTGVADRQPVDTTVAFAADVGQVYAWVRVVGATDQTIQIVWIHGDEAVPVSLEVGGSPWRTWSSKTVSPADTGDWSVEVRDAAGDVLATGEFTVGVTEESGSAPGAADVGSS